MKIGLLIDSMIGGGAERVVLNLAEGFRRKGHTPHLILVRNEIQHDLPDWLPVHVLSDDGYPFRNRLMNRLALAWRLRRTVAAEETSSGEAFAFFISNAEYADHLSALAGLRQVFIRYRNSMVEFYHGKLRTRTGLKRLFRRIKWSSYFTRVYGGRHLVTVSHALQEEITEQIGLHPASIVTIYNPFNFDAIRARSHAFEAPLDEPYIVYAARLTQRKRQDLLLQAYARSTARYTHKLVLLGDAYDASEQAWADEIKQLIVSLGLQDRVLCPGFQTNPYPWVRKAALFAMSSDSEGLPTVLIESLILGTPVVSTDCPTGPAEILTGELARFLCPRDDPAALAARMDSALLSYPPITDQMLKRFHVDYAINAYLRHCSPQSGPPQLPPKTCAIPH
jgi:glycosyltransferase involved in cell wall biosynthesis